MLTVNPMFMNSCIDEVVKTMHAHNISKLCAVGFANETGLLVVRYAETFEQARLDLLKSVPSLGAPNGLSSWRYFEVSGQ